MNPASKSPLPGVLDPVATAIIAQLQQKVEEQEAQLARSRQTLATTEMLVLKLKEELRLERILKYGKRSEKLSDMQLQMLDLEPAVSSEEIESEIKRGPLPNSGQNDTQDNKPRKRKQHPGRNELPAHLERVDEIIACAPAQCKCGKCGGETSVIGYEETEVLARNQPFILFVSSCGRTCLCFVCHARRCNGRCA